MKKSIQSMLVISALVASSSAMASIARQAVIGGQPTFTIANNGSLASNGNTNTITLNTVNGSLWYDDDYNVFVNPSYIMDNKNMVTFNKGLEGGFFSGFADNFAYGVYVNRGGGADGGDSYGGGGFVAPGMKANGRFYTGAAAANIIDTRRPIDFFIGGDTGIKWGLNITHAYNRDQTVANRPDNADTETSARYWHATLGAQIMGLEPFFGTTLTSKIQRNNKADNDNYGVINQHLETYEVGAKYKYEGWTPYLMYRRFTERGAAVGNPVDTVARRMGQTSVQTTVMGGGVGHDTKVADGVHVLKNVGVWRHLVSDDSQSATTAMRLRQYQETVVPINVAIEADAASWLTLRAGATYDFINQTNSDDSSSDATRTLSDLKQSNAGTATVRVGSTLKFGKLMLDSAIGSGVGAGAAALDSTNGGFDSQTFAFLSAAYRW